MEHGARQLVFVAAEAGAGKSRLVAEVARSLHTRGVPVLVGHCSSDLGLPFDPLATPIRTLLTEAEAGRFELPDTAEGTGDEARELLRLLTSGESPAAPSQVNLEVQALAAVLATLVGACAGGPMVIVLEDLHWAAESGLRALRHIVESTADLPLFILVTHRNTAPDASEALAEVTTEMLRWPGTHVIRLHGLETAEVTTYLTAVGAGDVHLLAQVADTLRERTGGNPFLLGEVWRDVRDRGGLDRLASDRLDVPSTLQTLVRQRLRQLSPDHRRAVNLGAIIGESFDVPLVSAAATVPWPAASVYEALSAAVAEGLVMSDPDRLGHYRFPHALARQAVLQEMEPFARASAHAAVAHALEGAGDVRDPGRLVQLAHHFSMAVGLGLEHRAATYLERAAALAATRLAHSDAATLLQRAAELVPDGLHRDRLTLAAAAAHVRAGHLEEARTLNEEVAMSGDPSLRLEAAVGHEAASWPTGVGALRSVELLEAALHGSALESGAPERVLACAAYGRALIYAGQIARGDDALDHAISQARAAGDQPLLLAVLTAATTGIVNLRIDQGVDAFVHQRARAAEAAMLARVAGDLRRLGSASQGLIYAAYILGDPAELDQAMSDLARVGRETQEPFWVWRGKLLSLSLQLMRCEFAGFGESLARSSRMASSFGHAWGQVDGPLSLPTFVFRRETGRLEFARHVLEHGDVPDHLWAPGLVGLYCELGMIERGRTLLRRTVSQDLPGLRASVTWPASLALLGEAAVSLADRESAEILLADAEPFAGLNLMAAEFLAPFGSAHRLLAGLRSVLGRPGVEDHFGAALEMDTRMGSPLHMATTRAEWTAWLRRGRAPTGRIQEQAVPARVLAQRHGLVRVLRLLGPDPGVGQDARVGADARVGPHTRVGPGPPTGELTAREVEVLRLIGLGGSNKDIARDLFISEHTVANHVRSILMKTGSSNRTAAAHHARRHGLLNDSDD